MSTPTFLNVLCQSINEMIEDPSRQKHLLIIGSGLSTTHALQVIWYRYVLPTLDPSYQNREYVDFTKAGELLYENRSTTIAWLTANGLFVHLFDFHANEVIEKKPTQVGDDPKYDIRKRTTEEKITRFKEQWRSIQKGSIVIIEQDPFGEHENLSYLEKWAAKFKCKTHVIRYR